MNNENITMTFTAEEWRLISVACMRAKPASFIGGPARVATLKMIAQKIATETGKVSRAGPTIKNQIEED